MSISHWADDRAAAAYRSAYARSLELWPTAHRTRLIDTPFGRTHVVESGCPSGNPVVLIHAASLSATQWYLQADHLGVGRHLFAIDILGDIGLSEQTAPMRTREDAADWLAATLDGLDVESPTLIGSSFGGFLATNVALQRPEMVRSLVLLAPAATLRPFKPLANLMIRMGSLLPLPMTVEPGLRGMMGGRLPDARIVAQMQVGVRGFRYDRGGIYPSELSDGELGRIDCPVLVLLGDREMIYEPAEAAERAQRVLPRADVEVIHGVGHLLGMQQPAYVNARIARFLDAHTRAVVATAQDRSPSRDGVPAALAGASG
jgi:pimeloyl-ACP methyl ester carboxylesterase